jgi:sucrose-6-phosphate hydrolase SacC (GH32 family)
MIGCLSAACRTGFAAPPADEPAAAPAKSTVSSDQINASRQLRLHMLADPYRPTYHFVIPEGFAFPFDPNGAIYWKGRYHLCYIYQDQRGVHVFGHVSSRDMLHWRHHVPALYPTPDSPEQGIFSGNCFVNRKGEATMVYHGVGAGNCMATSSDKNLDHWKKLPTNPYLPPAPPHAPYAAWDPFGWLEGDTYYTISGGPHAGVFKAKELTDKWQYVGDFLHHTVPGVDLREDISCADFFKLGNKRVLVCISHRLGTRYYVGEWKNEQFYPEVHERMSWADNAFFAPETAEAPDGRRILWAWILDKRSAATRTASGWSGEMSLPRVLTLGADNRLRFQPIQELETLRYDEKVQKDLAVAAGGDMPLADVQGDTIEVRVELQPQEGVKRCGIKVRRSPGGEEQTPVYYDAVAKKLSIDTGRSSSSREGTPAAAQRMLGVEPKNVEAGPFELQTGETLVLRVYVDKSVVEAFAGDRQAAMRHVYPDRNDSLGVSVFSEGGATKVKKVQSWEMMPSMPY